jgi:hypothetical protein
MTKDVVEGMQLPFSRTIDSAALHTQTEARSRVWRSDWVKVSTSVKSENQRRAEIKMEGERHSAPRLLGVYSKQPALR